GRRWRASAAGRRRGAGRGGSIEPLAGPAAVLTLLLVAAVAIGSFVSASALWVRYYSDLPDARSVALNALPADSILYDPTATPTLADIHKEGYRHYEQHLS